MNKRALMLTAASAALLSGHAFGQTCSSSQTAYCDIVTQVTTPLYTGMVNGDVTNGVSTASAGNPSGNLTIDTNGSLVISTSPPTAPALTINSGTSATPAEVTIASGINLTYQNTSYAVGALMEEASPNTQAGYGVAENFTGELYSVGTINLTGTGINKVGILFAGAAYYNSTTTGLYGNASTGVYPNTAYAMAGDANPSNLGVFTGVTGFQPTGNTSPVAIDLASGSILEVQGSSSYGIELAGPFYSTSNGVTAPAGGASVIGTIEVGGSIDMTATTAGSTTATGNTAILLAGWEQSAANPYNPALAAVGMASAPYAMVGDLQIDATGLISSVGQGSQGVVVQGAIDGGIYNSGTITTAGTTASPTTNAGANDPEGGSALIIANNVTGGIFNGGPSKTGNATTSATISTVGTSLAPTILISPGANDGGSYSLPITIGVVGMPGILNGVEKDYPGQYSLDNRGTITQYSQDADQSTNAISISGAVSSPVTLTGGIFNSGSITATAQTNTQSSTSSESAVAISIGGYTTVDTINSATNTLYSQYALTNTNEVGSGKISASVGGPDYGVATAISIAQHASLPSIFNSGTISAQAQTSTLTLAANNNPGTELAAYAITDASGTLSNIVNQGTISAAATTLDNNGQIAVAIDVSNNQSTPVAISDAATSTNSAYIEGDIHFGQLPGSLSIVGNSSNHIAEVVGNLVFNNACTTGSPGPCDQNHLNDQLMIGSYGTFAGEISEAGKVGSVDITIAPNGTLNLLTTLALSVNSTVSPVVKAGTPLSVGALNVASGGVLKENLSQGYNVNVYPGVSVIDAQSASIGDPAANVQTLQIGFGSYISTPTNKSATNTATFVLIQSASNIVISQTELSSLQTSLTQSQTGSATNAIPYLYTGNICTYNVSTATTAQQCTGPEPINSTASEIVFNLQPKTVGLDAKTQIPLTGYAAKLFPFVNEALANDSALGAAMVNDITDASQAAKAYSSFSPDVSGATRATAISLTDSATDIVAARQRELRMYVGQEGDTTLWGQQFAQRLSQNNTNSLPGYNDAGFGFVLGMDEGDRVSGRYGAALTFFTGGMSEKEPISAKTSSEYYLITGYSDWRGKGLFIDTQLSAGYGNLKGRRYLTLAAPAGDANGVALNREAIGNRSTETLAGSVTVGGIFNRGGTVLMPQFDLDGLTMREEGYTESGGGDGYNLHVQPYYANSLRAFIGGDVRQDINMDAFYLQPDLRFGYRYDIVNGAQKLKLNFASVDSANGQTLDQFSLRGPDPGHGNLVLGGGVSASTGAWSLGISYDYVRSGSGPSEQSGIFTLLGRI